MQLAELPVHRGGLSVLITGGYTALSLVWACISCKVVIADTLINRFRAQQVIISTRLLSDKDSGTGEAAQWGTIKEEKETKKAVIYVLF